MRALLECAPSLDACVGDVEAGLVFMRRIGSGNMVEVFQPYQWVIDALRRRAYRNRGAGVHGRVRQHPSSPSYCAQHSSDGRRRLR